MAITRIIVLFIILISGDAISVPEVHAQSGSAEFSLGIQYMREGEYEEAYEIFRKLMQENPRSFAIYDRAVTALINLKRYEDAAAITRERLDRVGADINTSVKLGEIFHIAGRADEAFKAWEEILARYSDNMQPYQRVAEAMNQRRLYREAVEVYKLGREQLGDPALFTFEIAGNLLAIGNYEQAMQEYLDILTENERRMNPIQRQLVSYDERELFDTAILLTQERIEREFPGSRRDLLFREFLVWLNMERGLYRRALATAKTLDQNSNNQLHALYQIGRHLRHRQEFELAESAFTYYLDLENHPMQANSYEELSRTYQDWAGYLIDNNLDFGGAADTLYRKAYDIVERLTYRFTRYDRIMEVLTIQAELALDHLKQPDDAASYHEKMVLVIRTESDEAHAHYIEGRILLFRGDFTMARVAFTRSNRIAGSGYIAERSRYYLGLGDFYNSDFDYSRMQLRALERQNTSFFANDALRLRYMIQNVFDEEGDNEPLKRYARARFLYDTGRFNDAADLLAPVLEEPANHPLHAESTLLLTRTLRQIHPTMAFHVLNHNTSRLSSSQNAGEQLLWERGRLAEMVHAMQQQKVESVDESTSLTTLSEDSNENGLAAFKPFINDNDLMILDGESAIGYYEELLMHYPDGFYANPARERIQLLEQEAREL